MARVPLRSARHVTDGDAAQARDTPDRGLVNNVYYLLIAVVLSGIGLLALWFRNRPAPTSPRSSVDEFNDKMRALAPDEVAETSGQRSRRGS